MSNSYVCGNEKKKRFFGLISATEEIMKAFCSESFFTPNLNSQKSFLSRHHHHHNISMIDKACGLADVIDDITSLLLFLTSHVVYVDVAQTFFHD
jgi:hypothetical protein